MIISAVVAMNSSLLIGKDNDLPWKLKDDLEHFKTYTLGKPIIMGRKTYESIGRPLPDRLNVVVSRTINEIDNLITVTSLKKAINEARIYCESHGQNEIVLIGGAGIFKEGLEILNKLVITWVDADDLQGDVYFPRFNINEWKETDSKDFSCSADNQFDFTIKEYLKL